MGKKKEYKKPLLADHDNGVDDEDESDLEDGFGTLKVEDDAAADGDAEVFTSQTSMFSSFDDEEEESFGDDDINESFRSTISSDSNPNSSGASNNNNNNNNNKRMSRTRHSQRRSLRNLTQSPGTLNNSARGTRRCDRKSGKGAASPGALSSRKTSNHSSPGALSRHSISGTRGASSSPHHLRRNARARRRNTDTNNNSPKPPTTAAAAADGNSSHSGHDRIEKGSQRTSRRKLMAKSISPKMGTSMRMLYSGHASKDELATPDLDDQDDDDDDSDLEEFAEDDDIVEEGSADDAELVRDELADLEGLIQAAKGVGVSS